MRLSLPLLLTFLVFLGVKCEDPKNDPPLSSYEVVYGWNGIDFKFETPEERAAKINSSEFIPKNNIITGIKVKGRRLFLAVPRWREGVPATLTYVDYNPNATISNSPTKQMSNGPLLMPYPDWKMQTLGDCEAFQYVQSMEVDQFNRLWVLDTGLHAASTIHKCPPKLVIIDLETNETVNHYTFPTQVVSGKSNFLSDIVVGCSGSPEECWAYITDSLEAKIIVFHLRNRLSWAVRHSSMKADMSATNITILRRSYEFKTNLDGIALSPADKAFDTVYYCALSSRNLYSVSTKTLQRAGSSGYEHNLLDTDVKLVGTKSSQSEGLAMDSQGLLFYGVLSSNAVSYWNSSSSYLNSSNTALLVQNDIELQWPDTFSFDDNGYLYASTNRLPRFISNSYDFSDINFRVVRVFVGTKSYQHSATEAVVNIGLVDKENALQIPDVVQLNGTAAGSQYDHSGDKANTKPSIPTGDTVSGQAENNVVPIITIASTILVAFMMA